MADLEKLINDRFDILEEYLLRQCATLKCRLDALDSRLDDIVIIVSRLENHHDNIITINKKTNIYT
jgi:hypothetical protein